MGFTKHISEEQSLLGIAPKSSLGAGRKPLPFKKNVVALRDDSLGVTNLNQFSPHCICCLGPRRFMKVPTGSLQFISKLFCIFKDVIQSWL